MWGRAMASCTTVGLEAQNGVGKRCLSAEQVFGDDEPPIEVTLVRLPDGVTDAKTPEGVSIAL
jgi:hypothetical protein